MGGGAADLPVPDNCLLTPIHGARYNTPTMARFARVIVPGYPYHVTHRGNRRGDLFFEPEDRDICRAWLRQHADEAGLDIWAYCLRARGSSRSARAIGMARVFTGRAT